MLAGCKNQIRVIDDGAQVAGVTAPAATEVCAGILIFGVTGTAICNSSFGDLISSNMHRDVGTDQMSLTTERTTTVYVVGYREVPNILNDDDGYNASSPIVKASRPTVDCGETGEISDRIIDCETDNGSTAIWEGAINGIAGEATWRLVTRKNGAEVWRDERTRLLWSDTDSINLNWCRASGNSQVDDPNGYCSNPGNQDAINPYSTCSEFPGSQGTFFGDNYVTGTYSDFKGGMGLLSSTIVRWRLPTRNDYLQADIDGISAVLPNMPVSFWASTAVSWGRVLAWVYHGGDGTLNGALRSGAGSNTVRCVGR